VFDVPWALGDMIFSSPMTHGGGNCLLLRNMTANKCVALKVWYSVVVGIVLM
jgi:hypothetical protein